MAKSKNCPNCGAPYDENFDKCPYCGTICFDMSSIDMDSPKPIWLRIKYQGMMISQKVIPRVENIEINNDYTDITDPYGNVIKTIMSKNYMTTDIKFQAIHQDDGELVKVYYE